MRHPADLDFATTAPRHPRLAWLLLLAGVSAAIVVADRHDAAAAVHERQMRQIERLERRLEPRPPKASTQIQKSALAPRHESADFPWDIVLRELELALDVKQLALLNLDTDAIARRSRLDGEARNIEAALAFAERLRALPITQRVLLLGHETRKTPAATVIAFSLQIDWDLP